MQLHGKCLRAALSLLLLLILTTPSWGEAPFSFDAAPGRLPKTVVPTDYRLAITPNLDAQTMHGVETVTLTVRAATTVIEFNSLNQTLDHVLFDGKPVKSVESDNKEQMTHVTLSAEAAPGVHHLSFAYDGKIETSAFGLYTQTLKRTDGRTDRILSTKFEATDARRMFPCWDEPAFRATFEVTLTAPAGWAAIGNMPVAKRTVKDGLATTTFQRTPKMPTYLVELTAGDFTELSGRVGQTRIGIWAMTGQQQDGAAALANAEQILADYNDYFGVAFPLPKLDSIATPGGFTGAMENWGAITYNERLLLITPASTLNDQQTVYSVQAHEMAHQWNGDLVTMGWWDDLWLNESFASWRASEETAFRHPDWNWWEGQDASKERAMTADARQASHAIQVHVSNELEARSAFDSEITYSKGEAVLHMLSAYIGTDPFRAGVRSFMKSHALSNATSADLWVALDAASGRKVSDVAADWIERPGFPVVSAAATCGADGSRTLTLTQKRFMLEGEDSDHLRWRVPVQLRVGAAGVPQQLLLADDGQTVAAGTCADPVSLNAAAIGYYRVAYDDATLATNTAAFGSLPSGDRIALLDDQWALVEGYQQKLERYLALANAAGGANADLNERVWAQITGALGKIEYAERGTPGHDAFAAYARSLLKPVAQKLGWDTKSGESPSIQRLRRNVISHLGEWGDADIVAEATRRFDTFVADRAALSPDDQELILPIVAINADQPIFDTLHGIARSANGQAELRRYYDALMNVRDAKLAAEAAEIALSPEIPPQSASLRLNLLFDIASFNTQVAWTALRDHVEEVLASRPQYRSLILAQSVPNVFWSVLPLNELEAWIKQRIPAEMSPNLARGMQAARFKLSEKAMLVTEADRFIGPSH